MTTFLLLYSFRCAKATEQYQATLFFSSLCCVYSLVIPRQALLVNLVVNLLVNLLVAVFVNLLVTLIFNSLANLLVNLIVSFLANLLVTF